MAKEIRLALCGTHAHAEKFGRMINSYPESETVAVWDEDPAGAQAVARSLGCRAEADLSALLADPAITGLVISTLNDRHRELTVQAAAAGKNIFLEKPLAGTLADARAIRDAVQGNNVKFYMTDPFVNASTTYLRNFMKSGKLGRILSVRVRFSNNVPLLQALPESAVLQKARRMGGGVMSDTGGHPLHILNYLMGNPQTVWARFAYAGDDRRRCGCEEHAALLMEYPGEVTAMVECGTMAAPYGNCIEICGTHGAIAETGLGDKSGRVCYRLCEITGDDLAGDDLRAAVMRSSWHTAAPEELGPEPDDHIRYFVRMQAEDIPNRQVGVDPKSTHGVNIDTALELMELREAIYEAARTGKGAAVAAGRKAGDR